MKFKLKVLAAVATLAVAGQASAALSDGFVQDGTMFLTVWDVTTNESYVRDLGVSLSQFLPDAVGGTKTPSAGLTEVFANLPGSTVFAGLFGNNTAGNIRWNVIAVDQAEGDGENNGARVVSTFGSTPGFLNSIVRGMAASAVNFVGELIQNSGVDFSGAPNEFGFTGTGATSIEGGGPGWGPTLAGGAGANNTTGTGFGTAQFWYAATTNDGNGNDSGVVNGVRFANSSNFATMGLAADGTLTYTLAGDVAAVPLPAAAWLLGAGILGLGSAARRRKTALTAA
jgi:hypothetical protein